MAARCVVVVGDAMLDIYLAGDAERISPEAPVPVVTVHTRRAALGGAANVAANVSAIGAECRLVAVIGDDARGDSLRTELAQNRLADRHIVVAAARPTTAKARVPARSAPKAWCSSPRTGSSRASPRWRARCSMSRARAIP